MRFSINFFKWALLCHMKVWGFEGEKIKILHKLLLETKNLHIHHPQSYHLNAENFSCKLWFFFTKKILHKVVLKNSAHEGLRLWGEKNKNSAQAIVRNQKFAHTSPMIISLECKKIFLQAMVLLGILSHNYFCIGTYIYGTCSIKLINIFNFWRL